MSEDVAAEPEFPILTDEELHDVTVAGIPHNGLEAIALIEMLEDNGIPAFQKQGLIHFGGLDGSELVVPRKVLPLAQKLIADFRQQAAQRGVEDAFAPESVAEHVTDATVDSVTEDMIELSKLPMEERQPILDQHIAQWLLDNESPVEISKRLAAAGLSREAAEAQTAAIKNYGKESLRSGLTIRFYLGLLLMIGGLALLVILIMAHRRWTLAFWMFCVGLVVMLQAHARLRELDAQSHQ